MTLSFLKYLDVSSLSGWFIGYVVLELVFWWFVHFFVLPDLQNLKKPPRYPDTPFFVVKRILDNLDELKTYSFEQWISGFFCGANIDDIKQDNLRSFLAWVLFASPHSKLSESDMMRVEAAMVYLAEHYDFSAPEGFNPKVNHVRMTHDRVPFIHRPLLMYFVSAVIEAVGGALYRSQGFRRLRLRGIDYWYCPGPRNSTKSPLLVFHGISSGWMTYYHLVSMIGVGRAVFLIDLEAIKVMSLCFEMPTPDKYSQFVKDILDRHHVVDKISVLGHSFGSITAGWFVRCYPAMVSHLTLLDPVSLLLGLPDVAYGFLYRPPTKFMEWLIYLVASQEITVSHTLYRNFWWYNNILYLEDIPSSVSVLVGLAGKDEVAYTVSVHEYVSNFWKNRQNINEELCNRAQSSSNGPYLDPPIGYNDSDLRGGAVEKLPKCGNVEVILWENYSHGQVTASSTALNSIQEALKRMES